VKIVENTPERLVLQHRSVIRPYITGFFILLFLVMAFFAYSDAPGITYGFILIAAMLTLALVVFDLARSRAEFSRRTGTVTIRHDGLRRGQPQVIQLGSIDHAFASISGTNSQVSGTTMNGGQKCPSLALRRGKSVRLSQIATHSKTNDLAVAAINAWLGRKPKG
jgi:hypothetical protein